MSEELEHIVSISKVKPNFKIQKKPAKTAGSCQVTGRFKKMDTVRFVCLEYIDLSQKVKTNFCNFFCEFVFLYIFRYNLSDLYFYEKK